MRDLRASCRGGRRALEMTDVFDAAFCQPFIGRKNKKEAMPAEKKVSPPVTEKIATKKRPAEQRDLDSGKKKRNVEASDEAMLNLLARSSSGQQSVTLRGSLAAATYPFRYRVAQAEV